MQHIAIASFIVLASLILAYYMRRNHARHNIAPIFIAHQSAVHVTAMEYRALMAMQYTPREARANIRAYVMRHYGHAMDTDQRAHVVRDAITHAQRHIARDNAERTIDGTGLIRAK